MSTMTAFSRTAALVGLALSASTIDLIDNLLLFVNGFD